MRYKLFLGVKVTLRFGVRGTLLYVMQHKMLFFEFIASLSLFSAVEVASL